MRVLIDHNPLAASYVAPADFSAAYQSRPAWVAPRSPAATPEVTAYRLRFELDEPGTIRAHISADERYLFYVDGQCAGRGPERGSDRAWFYETYDLALEAGSHTLVALVWRLGAIGPLAQVSLAGGFLLEAEGAYGALVSTRSAAWETRPVAGIGFSLPEFARGMAWFVEPVQTTDGAAYPWGVEAGAGDGWEPAAARREDFSALFGIQAAHVLQPAMLPAQMSALRSGGRVRYAAQGEWNDPQVVAVAPGRSLPAEERGWQALLDGTAALVIPAHTRRQVIIDLEEYYCAYPQVQVSGGAGSWLSLCWAEALYTDASGQVKGQRDEVEGRTFVALCRDVVLPDGSESRLYEPLWWRAGRFVQLLIQTEEQPLTVEAFALRETRYPLEMESRFVSSDPRLDAVTPVALRGLQMCAHETYMDCPYYEQMMYVGDTRLEALTTYAISTDDRLPRKAIRMFDLSRLPDGLTQARYPGRDVQVIPPFALWWVGMLYDYALWRGDRAFVSSMLPGMRAVLDGFLANVNADHLLVAPAGWNFSDWIATWPLGVPPDGFDGISGLLNWHLVYTLGMAVKLEEWEGEAHLARRFAGWRDSIASAAQTAFWDEPRGLLADDLAHSYFSEHTQCLALLSGALAEAQAQRAAANLLADPALTRTTIYFNHYLFETYRLLGQTEAFIARMGLWFDLPAQGFKTTPEQPEPSRSDCHGWGAHPLYHYFASLLGIRPAVFGFGSVEIAPQPGDLRALSGAMVHPLGRIEAELNFADGACRGSITLPAGLNGVLRFAGKTLELAPGTQTVDLA